MNVGNTNMVDRSKVSKALLEEIPGQLLSYMQSKSVLPEPSNFSSQQPNPLSQNINNDQQQQQFYDQDEMKDQPLQQYDPQIQYQDQQQQQEFEYHVNQDPNHNHMLVAPSSRFITSHPSQYHPHNNNNQQQMGYHENGGGGGNY